MNYACLIEKLNLLTEIYCDPMIRCPKFEEAYAKFYRASLKLSPELFKKGIDDELAANTESGDFSISVEVPKELEQYFTKAHDSYQNYLAQKNL